MPPLIAGTPIMPFICGIAIIPLPCAYEYKGLSMFRGKSRATDYLMLTAAPGPS